MGEGRQKVLQDTNAGNLDHLRRVISDSLDSSFEVRHSRLVESLSGGLSNGTCYKIASRPEEDFIPLDT